MKAVIKSIQVGGVWNADSLSEACDIFVREMPERSKIHFLIHCPDGEDRIITIRDEDDKTVAYGGFAELPDFLEYARNDKKEVEG